MVRRRPAHAKTIHLGLRTCAAAALFIGFVVWVAFNGPTLARQEILRQERITTIDNLPTSIRYARTLSLLPDTTGLFYVFVANRPDSYNSVIETVWVYFSRTSLCLRDVCQNQCCTTYVQRGVCAGGPATNTSKCIVRGRHFSDSSRLAIGTCLRFAFNPRQDNTRKVFSQRTTTTAAELFYLRHMRSCAAEASGANKAGSRPAAGPSHISPHLHMLRVEPLMLCVAIGLNFGTGRQQIIAVACIFLRFINWHVGLTKCRVCSAVFTWLLLPTDRVFFQAVFCSMAIIWPSFPQKSTAASTGMDSQQPADELPDVDAMDMDFAIDFLNRVRHTCSSPERQLLSRIAKKHGAQQKNGARKKTKLQLADDCLNVLQQLPSSGSAGPLVSTKRPMTDTAPSTTLDSASNAKAGACVASTCALEPFDRNMEVWGARCSTLLQEYAMHKDLRILSFDAQIHKVLAMMCE